MSRYVLGRLWLLVPTLVGMSLLVFCMLRLLPGDIVDVMTGGDIPSTAQTKERLREAFGLDKPLPLQYVTWIANIARGDLGTSFRSGEPITTILLRTLPITLELTLLAVIVATVCAIPLGVVVARLLRTPAAVARFSETTVAAYSLTPLAIHRLRAWQHAA